MSKTIASLLVGLLAIADGSSTDRELLSEANRDDVLNVISPELLDSIAKRLYTQDSSEMSAYERLVKEDKQRKMDYLNNVNREANSNGIPAPTANDFIPHHDHVREDVDPTSDAKSIKERIMREQERTSNAMKELKQKQKEERERKEKADLKALEEEEKYRGLTSDEIAQKRLEEKWRKEFELQQQQENAERSIYEQEMARLEAEERARKSNEIDEALYEQRKQEKDDRKKANELERKQQEELDKKEKERLRREKDKRKKERDQKRKADEEAKKIATEKELRALDKERKNREKALADEDQLMKNVQELVAAENDMLDEIAERDRKNRHEANRREKDGRRAEKERRRKDRDDQIKNKEEAYKALLDEQHRIEEAQHRREQRKLDQAKKEEDRRRKKWEDYEKCLEEEAMGKRVLCRHPFPETLLRDVRSEGDRESSSDDEGYFHRQIDLPSSSDDEESSDEVSEEAIERQRRHHYETGLDYMTDEHELHRHHGRQHHQAPPDSAQSSNSSQKEDAVEPKSGQHAPGAHKDSKPISETHRRHHHRHHTTLEANSVPYFENDFDFLNDLEFDVNKDLRLHMKSGDNYRGRDVQFDVHLPHDLVQHQPSAYQPPLAAPSQTTPPQPAHASHQAQSQQPTPAPKAQAPPTQTPKAQVPKAQPKAAAPAGPMPSLPARHTSTQPSAQPAKTPTGPSDFPAASSPDPHTITAKPKKSKKRTLPQQPVAGRRARASPFYEDSFSSYYSDEDSYYGSYYDSELSDDYYDDGSDFRSDYGDYDNAEYDEFDGMNEYWDLYDQEAYLDLRQRSNEMAFNGPSEVYRPSSFGRDYGAHHGAHHGEYHDVSSPKHAHTFDYMSAYDPWEKQRQDDRFFEDMYGYGEHKVHDHGYALSEYPHHNNLSMMNLIDEDDSNDINFKINDDVEFTLSTSDNYEGRDIMVGVELPDDFDGSGMPYGAPRPQRPMAQAPAPSMGPSMMATHQQPTFGRPMPSPMTPASMQTYGAQQPYGAGAGDLPTAGHPGPTTMMKRSKKQKQVGDPYAQQPAYGQQQPVYGRMEPAYTGASMTGLEQMPGQEGRYVGGGKRKKPKLTGMGYDQPYPSPATMDGFSTDAMYGGYRHGRQPHHSYRGGRDRYYDDYDYDYGDEYYDDEFYDDEYGDDYYDDEYYDDEQQYAPPRRHAQSQHHQAMQDGTGFVQHQPAPQPTNPWFNPQSHPAFPTYQQAPQQQQPHQQQPQAQPQMQIPPQPVQQPTMQQQPYQQQQQRSSKQQKQKTRQGQQQQQPQLQKQPQPQPQQQQPMSQQYDQWSQRQGQPSAQPQVMQQPQQQQQPMMQQQAPLPQQQPPQQLQTLSQQQFHQMGQRQFPTQQPSQPQLQQHYMGNSQLGFAHMNPQQMMQSDHQTLTPHYDYNYEMLQQKSGEELEPYYQTRKKVPKRERMQQQPQGWQWPKDPTTTSAQGKHHSSKHGHQAWRGEGDEEYLWDDVYGQEYNYMDDQGILNGYDNDFSDDDDNYYSDYESDLDYYSDYSGSLFSDEADSYYSNYSEYSSCSSGNSLGLYYDREADALLPYDYDFESNGSSEFYDGLSSEDNARHYPLSHKGTGTGTAKRHTSTRPLRPRRSGHATTRHRHQRRPTGRGRDLSAPTHFGRQTPHHHEARDRVPLEPESAKEKKRQAQRRAAEKVAKAEDTYRQKTRKKTSQKKKRAIATDREVQRASKKHTTDKRSKTAAKQSKRRALNSSYDDSSNSSNSSSSSLYSNDLDFDGYSDWDDYSDYSDYGDYYNDDHYYGHSRYMNSLDFFDDEYYSEDGLSDEYYSDGMDSYYQDNDMYGDYGEESVYYDDVDDDDNGYYGDDYGYERYPEYQQPYHHSDRHHRHPYRQHHQMADQMYDNLGGQQPLTQLPPQPAPAPTPAGGKSKYKDLKISVDVTERKRNQLANEMRNLYDIQENKAFDHNGAGDLAFSEDSSNSYENGFGNFHMDDGFSCEMSGFSNEQSVDFSNSSMEVSMNQNGGSLDSYDYNDISDFSSDFASYDNYMRYHNEFSSDQYYSDSVPEESLFSSEEGSEAQFSDDIHDKIAQQRRAEEADWNHFAEYNTYAHRPHETSRRPHHYYESSSYTSDSSFSSSTSSYSSTSSESSISSISSSDYQRWLRRNNGLPAEPKAPKQPANVWRYVDGEPVLNLETQELKNWLSLGYSQNVIDEFFSNAATGLPKKKSSAGKDSKKKSTKKQSPKKKTSTHLKPRKPIKKEKGVLAFPEEKDYREMQEPAKKKFVSADAFLGDQYEMMSMKQKTSSDNKKPHAAKTSTPKKIIPSPQTKAETTGDSSATTARYLDDQAHNIKPHTATPYMQPSTEAYKPYYDSEMLHQFDMEDETMDFMTEKPHHKKQDSKPSSQKKSKKSKTASGQKEQSKDKRSPVIHRPEDLQAGHGAIHYEYQLPYQHPVASEPVDVTHEAMLPGGEHYRPGMTPQPYYIPQMFPPMPAAPQYGFYGGYADPHQKSRRTAAEQAEFMREQMLNPYHYEDERLGMDLLVPPTGHPQDYMTPYAYYSHIPLQQQQQPVMLDQGHAPQMHEKSSQKSKNEGSTHADYSRYFDNSELEQKDQIYPYYFENLAQVPDTIPYVFDSPHSSQKSHEHKSKSKKDSKKHHEDVQKTHATKTTHKSEDLDVLHAALIQEPHHSSHKSEKRQASPASSQKTTAPQVEKSKLAQMTDTDRPHTLSELGREALAMHHQTLHPAELVDHRDDYLRAHDQRHHESMAAAADYHLAQGHNIDDPYRTAQYGLTHQQDPYQQAASLFHQAPQQPLEQQYHDFSMTPYMHPETPDYDHMMQGGWGWNPYDPYHVDPRHSAPASFSPAGYYLDEDQLEENQYLALFGARELFAQLGQEPSRPALSKKSHRRSRRNGDDSSDSEEEDAPPVESEEEDPPAESEEEDPPVESESEDTKPEEKEEDPPKEQEQKLNGDLYRYPSPQMNLAGATELFQQLAREAKPAGERRKWTRNSVPENSTLAALLALQ